MSRPFPDDPFLRGNYAPWPMEGDIRDLVVEGEIPRELDGTLYRNGPNPQFAPRGRYHWFDGDGMIHAFTIRDGKCDYRNRWVRTEKFKTEREAGEALFPGLRDITNMDPRAEGIPWVAANTNIVTHNGRLFALVENAPPTELNPHTLETIGPNTFDGRLAGAMTAHPKFDPETGEMLFFGYGFMPPYLQYHVVSANGELVRSEVIDIPVPVMMHDFIVTRDHVVFMVCPATMRLENMVSGDPIRWEPELGTQVGVMPRDGGNADVTWLETNPCFVFHPLNGYSEEGRVVADLCRYDRLPLFDGNDAGNGLQDVDPATLTRWTLDLAAGTLKEEQIDDAPSEFPRLDERFAGLRHRMGITGGYAGGDRVGGPFNAVLRYDCESGSRRTHALGDGSFTSEPVFVPRREDSPEGEGFVLAVVYREAENRSDLVILDAENIEDKPLATVKLPHRVPHGFHGNWGQGF